MTAQAFVSGKDHRTENFPVGSRLIAARHRPAVMAYYRFARAADDIADARADADVRLDMLDAMEHGLDAGLRRAPDTRLPAVAQALGAVMADRSLDPANARDLLTAFRRDVSQHRTADWPDLMDYCRWSAMPVGRFMLDVHGEAPALRPASDALCAALQLINHLQDCRADFADLGRVYLPEDALRREGITADALALPTPPAALAQVVRDLAAQTRPLLTQAAALAGAVASRGLAYEVAVIHALAADLLDRLAHAPFAPSRHHGRFSATRLALGACIRLAQVRLRRTPARPGGSA